MPGLLAERKLAHRSSRQTGWLGIDVGSRAVKMASIEQASGQLRLAFAQSLNSSFDEDRAPAVDMRTDLESRLSPVAALTVAQRNLPTTAACTLPAHCYDLRCLKLSSADDKSRKQEAHALLAQDQPDLHKLELEVAVWPIEPAAEDRDGFRMVVGMNGRLAAMAAGIVEKSVKLCADIDAPSFALARAAEFCSSRKEPRTVAMLDIGMQQVLFVACRNGRPLFSRPLRCQTGHDVVLGIARRLGLQFDEALTLFQAYGEQAFDQTAQLQDSRVARMLHELAIGLSHDLAAELRRTMLYLESHARPSLPERFILAGCGALLPGLSGDLQHQMHIPVRPWGMDHLDSVPATGHVAEPLFAQAVGLSATGWSA